ncbi:DUF6766 family protein [Chitinophaga agrisoli]|nr:DUF6766 family protein [Chitinophaga agrisoli]
MENAANRRHSMFYRNGLTIVFLSLLILALGGQAYTGWQEHNEELTEKGGAAITFLSYLTSNHFLEATFENWESEFLQMAAYVWLTVWLRQKGSAESKDLDKPEEVDREPRPHPDAPWPVKKGGVWLSLYKHSLSLAFFLLFMVSFVLHFKGSRGDYNVEQLAMGKPIASIAQYLVNKRFWFESFQNWQSEFLSVAAIVFLSIYLRQKGSPESKPVDAPHSETGK